MPIGLVTSVLPRVFFHCPIVRDLASNSISHGDAESGGRSSTTSDLGRGDHQENAIIPRPNDSKHLPRSLEVNLKRLPLSVAVTSMGLSSKWVDAFVAANERSQVLAISECLHGAPSSEHFEAGDLLLAIDGEHLCAFHEVEQFVGSKHEVDCSVLRDGIEVELQAVPTAALDGEGTSRVLVWAGLVLQSPYRGVREMGPVASEVCTRSTFDCNRQYDGDIDYLIEVSNNPLIVKVRIHLSISWIISSVMCISSIMRRTSTSFSFILSFWKTAGLLL
jgi:hypothetical protein